MPEQVIASRRAFEGQLFQVRVDTVRMPDGSERPREVVEHPGAVGILPVLPDGELVMVRQYRHAVGRTLLEIPAGTREAGESAEECALRELQEETGYTAKRLRELVRFYVSPGWANEELVVYVAEDIHRGVAEPEGDEDLEVAHVRRDAVLDVIRRGEIADSKTILSLLGYLGLGLTQS